MDYKLKDIGDAHARALFSVGDAVTIQIFDKDGTDVTPTSPADECTAYGELDTFQWPYSNLATLPTVFQEYSWVMTNQSSIKQRDVDSFSAGGGTFLQIPFDINIFEQNIVKGNDWNPEFRIDSNSSGLKVAIELSDMETYIYKATSNVTDRGDGEAGGDDQILLLSEMDTFQYFRLYLSGTETESFDSRNMDMAITVKTADDIIQTPTVKKKIGFTEFSAIKIGP